MLEYAVEIFYAGEPCSECPLGANLPIKAFIRNPCDEAIDITLYNGTCIFYDWSMLDTVRDDPGSTNDAGCSPDEEEYTVPAGGELEALLTNLTSWSVWSYRITVRFADEEETEASVDFDIVE